MPLQKTPLNINFAQGLDLKTDPKQVSLGKFLSLQNSIFTKTGLLQKRNGFAPLNALPDSTYLTLTTFTEGLVAIGKSLSSYSQSTGQWINKGPLQLCDLSTLPLVRSSTNQTYCDSQTASNGLICTAYVDILASGPSYKYIIADSTGNAVVPATLIVALGGGVVCNSSPRVFLLGMYFIVAFPTSNNHLQFIAIPISNPTMPLPAMELALTYFPQSGTPPAWDGISYGDQLYIAYATNSTHIIVTFFYSNLTQYAVPQTYAATLTNVSTFALAVDSLVPQDPIIYIAWGNSGPGAIVISVTDTLFPVTPPTPVSVSAFNDVLNIALTADHGAANVYLQVDSNEIPAQSYIQKIGVNQNGTLTGVNITLDRGLGLASKAFSFVTLIQNTITYILPPEIAYPLIQNGLATFVTITDYMLTAYNSLFQPTYFLISGTPKHALIPGTNVVSRLAYSNGGGYLTMGLPNITQNGSTVQIPYLLKDLIAGINKGTALVSTPTNPISIDPVYSQTGVNLVTLDLNPDTVSSVEIANTLNISGGMLWSYDGVTIAEQGFNLFPDTIAPPTASAGSIPAGTYYYQVIYQWTDNNGNVNRSAPSIPVAIITSGSENILLVIPTLRLTYKTNVSIVVYRWSVLQQVYYAILSPSVTPVPNDPTVDFVFVTDTATDAQILGNPILYTIGGVIEDIPGPATNLIALFNNRLFLVDAEDTNLLWFSKQVIETTPVEMSDLLTLYVAPTTGAQGSTGPTTAIAPLDDKIVLFKKDAIYYINGIGPDNTGSNSQYSDAIFISSVVGCSNQNSIIFIPNGLMFQSDKGIWLLGRDLSTSYIGAPVENLTLTALVKSALSIPGTNQVRFTMDSSITLMYDYYFQQWGTFTNIPAISSTLYNALHTYINSSGAVFQETPNLFLDNSNPVLMQFTTGWGNLAGLQGYERLYFLFLLGQYITPFKLNTTIAYNYDPNVHQSIIVEPDNYSAPWGVDTMWGNASPWGGISQVFKARLFPQTQKCESFQLSIQEIYDPTQGAATIAEFTLLIAAAQAAFNANPTPENATILANANTAKSAFLLTNIAGAGLTLSGMNMVVGVKKGYRTQQAGRSFG
jgi:hypothetical protein